MSKYILTITLLVLMTNLFVLGCLITNCPRGGKRNGKFALVSDIKPCVSCGPGHSGQCFGPNICCGPFGCLIGTTDTIRCQKEGFFQRQEPCIAGSGPCSKNTGRCAIDGICCNQDSCHSDKSCLMEDKVRSLSDNVMPIDIYSLINYQAEVNE